MSRAMIHQLVCHGCRSRRTAAPRRALFMLVTVTVGVWGWWLLGLTLLPRPEAAAQTAQVDLNSMQDQSRQDTRQASPASRASGRIESNVSRRDASAQRSAPVPNLGPSVMDNSRYDASQRSSAQPLDNTAASSPAR